MHSLFIQKGKSYRRVAMSDILWVEALKDYMLIYTAGERFIVNRTMKDVERKLRPYNFSRVHRSYLVNIGSITYLNASRLLIGDKVIPVGKMYKNSLLKKIERL